MAKSKLPESSFEISNGPSKFDFMVSLFDGKQVKLTCDISTPQTGGLKIQPVLRAVFQFAGPEDGSRERWFGTITFVDVNYEVETRRFYYDCRTRKGTVRDRNDKSCWF